MFSQFNGGSMLRLPPTVVVGAPLTLAGLTFLHPAPSPPKPPDFVATVVTVQSF